MPAEHIICIYQGEDGAVCGEIDCNCRPDIPPHHIERDLVDHEFVPGRKCPTCDGSGKKIRGQDIDLITGFQLGDRQPCPTCADSPVRGYVELE